jgi:hypothetical protein
VHDVSGEVQKFSGEVQSDLRGGAPLPSKSGHVWKLNSWWSNVDESFTEKNITVTTRINASLELTPPSNKRRRDKQIYF